MKENEHKIVGSTGNELARIWWDGKEIKCSSTVLLNTLKSEYGLKTKEGPEQINDLYDSFKNGYLRIKRV